MPRQMAQWTKHLLCKCEDLGSYPKYPCRKLDSVACIYHPSSPKARLEVEARESPDAHGAAVNKRPVSSKMECKEQHLRLSTDLYMHA